MKRLKQKYNGKDRIVCIEFQGKLQMYYQPVYGGDKYGLFDMNINNSVLKYFRDYGRHLQGNEYSLTIGQLHQCNKYRKTGIAEFVKDIDAVIRKECICRADNTANRALAKRKYEHYCFDDYEFAA